MMRKIGGEKGYHDNGIDGFHAKLLAENNPSCYDKTGIDYKIRYLYWISCGPIDNRGDLH